MNRCARDAALLDSSPWAWRSARQAAARKARELLEAKVTCMDSQFESKIGVIDGRLAAVESSWSAHSQQLMQNEYFHAFRTEFNASLSEVKLDLQAQVDIIQAQAEKQHSVYLDLQSQCKRMIHDGIDENFAVGLNSQVLLLSDKVNALNSAFDARMESQPDCSLNEQMAPLKNVLDVRAQNHPIIVDLTAEVSSLTDMVVAMRSDEHFDHRVENHPALVELHAQISNVTTALASLSAGDRERAEFQPDIHAMGKSIDDVNADLVAIKTELTRTRSDPSDAVCRRSDVLALFNSLAERLIPDVRNISTQLLAGYDAIMNKRLADVSARCDKIEANHEHNVKQNSNDAIQEAAKLVANLDVSVGERCGKIEMRLEATQSLVQDWSMVECMANSFAADAALPARPLTPPLPASSLPSRQASTSRHSAATRASIDYSKFELDVDDSVYEDTPESQKFHTNG